MGTDTPSPTACPHCGATVRPGAPFCSLCHADFRPRPVVVEEQAPVAAYAMSAPAVDPLTAPLVDVVLPPQAQAPAPQPVAIPEQHVPAVPAPRAEPQWPCHACGTSNALSLTVCGGCGSAFLAGASEKIKMVVPGVGDVLRLSRAERITIALGGALLVGLVPVVLAVLGKVVS